MYEIKYCLDIVYLYVGWKVREVQCKVSQYSLDLDTIRNGHICRAWQGIVLPIFDVSVSRVCQAVKMWYTEPYNSSIYT